MGDRMMLVYIQNRNFLTKIVECLDVAKITYTTDTNAPYSYILVADMTHKTEKFIMEHLDKKVIFITQLEEYKMYNSLTANNKESRSYQLKMNRFLKLCHKIITSSLYLQQEFLKKHINVQYIPVALPVITISSNNREIYERYNLPKRRKKIIIVDILYKHIDTLFLLSEKYPKYHFIYIGYEAGYNLSARQKNFLKMMSDNISYVKYVDLSIFSDICKLSSIVIYFETFILPREYLYIPILFKKILLVEDILWYQNFLINSKNAYLFNNNDSLILKFSKIIEGRVMNLTERAYELIQECDYTSVIKKYRDYL